MHELLAGDDELSPARVADDVVLEYRNPAAWVRGDARRRTVRCRGRGPGHRGAVCRIRLSTSVDRRTAAAAARRESEPPDQPAQTPRPSPHHHCSSAWVRYEETYRRARRISLHMVARPLAHRRTRPLAIAICSL